ncbi:CPA2 family monovalent cation:H+ antiporter-2 [Catalinimonas alkaloidigena]|uniref:cation:proton antiporter domain-containing protein n=1 Tax=Catalinimonas alkaloidigena TaxID=1075417 RepID=UPI002405698B|nr:cation:proton antiporter [Catalinimonas alkaloidigena]MDF9795047.1 CPA2 family monovalent cation:H+ antiporter-2 [Catalinimonas alkaloidigena]
MEIPLLTDIIIILGASVFVIYLFQRLNLPTILGYLMTGIIAGPYVLALITASHEIEVMAEIGVILLLFIIGMEFSLKSLAAIKNSVLIGGAVQVGLTILITALIAMWTGFTMNKAIFLGFVFSLSSTAIVLKLLQERNEVNSPHGKVALAVLIFQDIIVVPMMLLTPILSGNGGDIWITLGELLLKAGGVIVIVLFGARYLIPFLLHEVAKTKSRELFILFIVVICFAVAWATSSIGLSLALGAFLAGLIISESDYSYQATGFIIPFREIFTSFFFVSIGMLLDVVFLLDNLLLILGILALVFVFKTLIAGSAAFILGYPLRTAVLTGLSLFQVGEFAFILSDVGIENELLSENTYQYFLSVSILSMAITPFIIQNSGKVTRLFSKTNLPDKMPVKTGSGAGEEMEELIEKLKDHTIIIGYGVNGRNVAQAAKFAKIPYVIIEMNAETVRLERAKGEPILFGDATNPFILEHVKVYSARVAIVAISDPPATKGVVSSIRTICPTVHMIVRTRFMYEMREQLQLGASEVIPEEFETSVEIFTRLLHKYLVPHDEIERFVQTVRSDNYEMLRPREFVYKGIAGINIPNMNISSLRVQNTNKEVVGKKIDESKIRSRFGVNILAIQREDDYLAHIEADTEIRQDDILFLAGKPEDISRFHELIKV